MKIKGGEKVGNGGRGGERNGCTEEEWRDVKERVEECKGVGREDKDKGNDGMVGKVCCRKGKRKKK